MFPGCAYTINIQKTSENHGNPRLFLVDFQYVYVCSAIWWSIPHFQTMSWWKTPAEPTHQRAPTCGIQTRFPGGNLDDVHIISRFEIFECPKPQVLGTASSTAPGLWWNFWGPRGDVQARFMEIWHQGIWGFPKMGVPLVLIHF